MKNEPNAAPQVEPKKEMDLGGEKRPEADLKVAEQAKDISDVKPESILKSPEKIAAITAAQDGLEQSKARAELLFKENQQRAKNAGEKKWDKESAYYREWYFSTQLVNAYQKLAKHLTEGMAIDDEVTWKDKEGNVKVGRISESQDSVVEGSTHLTTEKNKSGFAISDSKLKLKEVADLEHEIEELKSSLESARKTQREEETPTENMTAVQEMDKLEEASKQSYSGVGGFFKKGLKLFGWKSKAEKT